ncbi:MAG: class I SAM-dependent methyltransferase [Candidatus Latescibacteria bacterium]|nr:class I SAM-dependent methyltransferase [Candidatus Latescibacterota bacterium]
MTFYEDLSDVYDIVFRENPRAVEFLDDLAGNGGRVLDCACGTGTCACALAGRGRDVVGIDFDASMIRLARKKCRGSNVRFIAGDMREAATLLGDERFDVAYCIGNSVVHLPDPPAIGDFFRVVYGLLSENGSFVVQIVNFDRILAQGVTELPTIENGEHGVRFRRFYDFEESKRFVRFRAELSVRRESSENEVKLVVLRSAKLAELLAAAGYGRVELFGGYDRLSHTGESPATVALAVK